MKLNINAHLGCLGIFQERYVPGGYFDPIEFEEALEIMSNIKYLDGIDVWYPGHPLIEEPEKLKEKVEEYGLKIADIGPEIWSDRKYKYGSLTATDKKIRKEAIKIVKQNMDLAVELGANSVLLWPAHDGSDYVFQADYGLAWDLLIESLEEIGSHNPEVKVAIEYKQRDPRAKSYIENVGKVMFLIKSLKAENIGGILDMGHALMAGERMAESLILLDKYHKLYQVHLNDNYKDSDPDLLFGTINFWETLELFYWLGKIDYDGWFNIDTVCPRNDRGKMLQLAVNLVKDYERLANKLLEHSDYIDNNLKKNNFVDNMGLIRQIIFMP